MSALWLWRLAANWRCSLAKTLAYICLSFVSGNIRREKHILSGFRQARSLEPVGRLIDSQQQAACYKLRIVAVAISNRVGMINIFNLIGFRLAYYSLSGYSGAAWQPLVVAATLQLELVNEVENKLLACQLWWWWNETSKLAGLLRVLDNEPPPSVASLFI